LDLDFAISNDPLRRHRALRILRPTVDMTGEYVCKVSTMRNEASAAANMIVYGEREGEFSQSTVSHHLPLASDKLVSRLRLTRSTLPPFALSQNGECEEEKKRGWEIAFAR